MRDARQRSVQETRLRGATAVCLLAWALALGLPGAGSAWAGTIQGTVKLAGPAVEPKKLPVTVDHSVCGKEKEAEDLVLSPGRGIRNVVVSLQTPPPDATWKGPQPPVQMDQRQCVFIPRVIIVPVGGTVEFLNGDRLLHNLRTRNTANPAFNRTQPKGRAIPIAFSKPEIIKLECDLHPWMRAWVVVAEHPFYVITNDRGEFVLGNVPPGKYSLQLWQEVLGTVTRDMTVGDGITTVTVEMTRK
jgi:plastocyanin